MNNVNKPMTLSKSQENAGDHEGNPHASTTPMIEMAEAMDSKMDMSCYARDNWQNAHMDGLPQSETAGGSVGNDPNSNHTTATGSGSFPEQETAGGAVGKDPNSNHTGDEEDPIAAFETASGFKSGWGDNY